MAEIYEHNIFIAPQYCDKRENPVNATQKDGDAFIAGTRALLDQARKASASFQTLIMAISRSNHPVTIYMAQSKTAGVGPRRNVTGDTLQHLELTRVEGQAYASHRSRIASAISDALGNPAKRSFDNTMDTKFLKDKFWFVNAAKLIQEKILNKPIQREFEAFLEWGLDHVKSGKYGEARFVDEVFTRNEVRTPVNYYKPLYERLGTQLLFDGALNCLPRSTKDQVVKRIRTLLRRDTGPIDANFLKNAEMTNQKGYLMTKLELEPYLIPGLGCGSNVIFNLHAKRTSPSDPKMPEGSKPDQDSPWNFRPVEVGLAHELIHAWRNASGRTIFAAETLEDEAMVIGIGDFSRTFPEFTENRIRAELKLASRPETGRGSMFA